jgi:hypothetical protein
MNFNFTNACSLGPICQSSNILKQNKLKMYSYPFDWIFSTPEIISHCLEDDFNAFLNKSNYTKISINQCGHLCYHKQMFYHHNPLMCENDYNYFVRCVIRFKQLLVDDTFKLFLMIFVNYNDNLNFEQIKHSVILFNNNLCEKTTNYKLLCIYNIANKECNYHEFTNNGNIWFLELHTLSKSDGLKFENNCDNIYLNKIMQNINMV